MGLEVDNFGGNVEVGFGVVVDEGELVRAEVVKLDEASGSDCQAAGSSFRVR